MISLDSVPIPCSGFTVREIGDEIIFIAEDGDELHTLDEVGCFIWKNIDGKNSLMTILNSICKEYDVEKSKAELDLKVFVLKLKDKGIIDFK